MKRIIIDVGHGGMWSGLYCTAGKRSPAIPPGFYEGVQVRRIARRLITMATDRYQWIAPLLDLPEGNEPDVSLKCRRLIYNAQPADLLLSLHTNAKGNAGNWERARGTKIFYRKATVKGSRAFIGSYCDMTGFPNRGAARNLTFSILKSKHPAILIEMGFHTSKRDIEILQDESLIARSLISGIDSYFQK
jgi:N-acetylmuramoyl-L-alanine amidase